MRDQQIIVRLINGETLEYRYDKEGEQRYVPYFGSNGISFTDSSDQLHFFPYSAILESIQRKVDP